MRKGRGAVGLLIGVVFVSLRGHGREGACRRASRLFRGELKGEGRFEPLDIGGVEKLFFQFIWGKSICIYVGLRFVGWSQ
ncbi:hypothetical protein [Bartonella sp. AD13SXNS]|uniref:hypothetical protein n=1 Tax=Bartonella sp. AD13SXNS TaxID=3243462 RepID=UPI0035D0B165